MLTLCTKNVHFTWIQNIFTKRWCSHGFTYRTGFTRHFHDRTWISLLSNLTKYITFWKRYVDDTICFVKIGTTKFIISVFNSFDKHIQFTFEQENDESIPFLDILISRKRNDITTAVYRKSTCNDIYLNWNAFAPATWKRGTLKILEERA